MKNPLTEYGLFGWNYRYLVCHPWVTIEESYSRIKWFIQRGYRGYAECDVWSLDGYLARYMGNALRELSVQVHGTPLIETGRPLDPDDYDALSMAEWKATITYIAETFDIARKISSMDYVSTSETQDARRRVAQGLAMFSEYFFDLWD